MKFLDFEFVQFFIIIFLNKSNMSLTEEHLLPISVMYSGIVVHCALALSAGLESSSSITAAFTVRSYDWHSAPHLMCAWENKNKTSYKNSI